MSKYSIEENTLTSIADAIRNKKGTTDAIKVSDMANEIYSMNYSPDDVTEEDLTFTGSVLLRINSSTIPQHIQDAITNFIETYKYKMRFKDVSSIDIPYLKNGNYNIFKINFKQNEYRRICDRKGFMRYLNNIKTFPVYIGKNFDLHYLFYGLNYVRYIPDNFFDYFTFDSFSDTALDHTFYNCYSLRKIPEKFTKILYNYEKYTNTGYNYSFYNCQSLDEILDIQNIEIASGTFEGCSRLKNITFADTGSSHFAATDKTIDLSKVGYAFSTDYKDYILNYNSGITADKEVTDDTTYQALKNDPDWFTCDVRYSRYNHDSAVRTINSLYSSSKATIIFKGISGSFTDEGVIRTLTPSEIAVATAKGWTVSLK